MARTTALWLVAAGLLLACAGSDPVVTVVRIVQPRGDVAVSLSAADTAGLPDRVVVRWDGVPPQVPRGFIYEVWLVPPSPATPRSLGRFPIPRDSVVSPGLEGTELVNEASAVQVTLEPEDEDPNGLAVQSSEFLTHEAAGGAATRERILALLGGTAGAADTGWAIRFAVRARTLRAFAEQARARADAGDVSAARRHLEHILNLAEVPAADHDGDGVTESPQADDLGLDSIARGAAGAARAAFTSPDAWEDAVVHGGQAALAADTTASRLERLEDLVRAALGISDLDLFRGQVSHLRSLSDTIVGEPGASFGGTCALCGALTAWHHGLMMTTRRALPQESFVVPPAVSRVPATSGVVDPAP